MPFAATWMHLEMNILSKSDRKRQIPYITYMWNLKYDTNELIYKTEIDSQGFPCGAVVKNPPANAGDTGSSPGLGRSPHARSN